VASGPSCPVLWARTEAQEGANGNQLLKQGDTTGGGPLAVASSRGYGTALRRYKYFRLRPSCTILRSITPVRTMRSTWLRKVS
jgi:hypothetical protein